MPCKTFRQSKISKFNDIINGISIDVAYSQTEEKNERAAIRGKFLNDDFHGIERAPIENCEIIFYPYRLDLE